MEKDTVEKVYQQLMEEHRTLQSNLDDAVQEKDEAIARVRQFEREMEAEGRRNDGKADVMMRAEIDRLRADLYVQILRYVTLLVVRRDSRRGY